MTPNMPLRLAMTLFGALAALALYWLSVVVDENLLDERVVLALAAFAVTFFGGAMAMAGPVALPRAADSTSEETFKWQPLHLPPRMGTHTGSARAAWRS